MGQQLSSASLIYYIFLYNICSDSEPPSAIIFHAALSNCPTQPTSWSLSFIFQLIIARGFRYPPNSFAEPILCKLTYAVSLSREPNLTRILQAKYQAPSEFQAVSYRHYNPLRLTLFATLQFQLYPPPPTLIHSTFTVGSISSFSLSSHLISLISSLCRGSYFMRRGLLPAFPFEPILFIRQLRNLIAYPSRVILIWPRIASIDLLSVFSPIVSSTLAAAILFITF